MNKKHRFFFLLTFFAFACKKEKSEVPQAPEPQPTAPVGYWTGIRTPIASGTPEIYAIHFKAGGTARVYQLGNSTDTSAAPASAKFDATWTKTGNTVEFEHKISATNSKATATLNDAQTAMGGNHKVGNFLIANFSLSKQ